MATKEQSVKFLGILAVVSTASFLLLNRKNPENKGIDGLSINVDPELLIEKYIPKTDNPQVDEIISRVTKTSISKILG